MSSYSSDKSGFECRQLYVRHGSYTLFRRNIQEILSKISLPLYVFPTKSILHRSTSAQNHLYRTQRLIKTRLKRYLSGGNSLKLYIHKTCSCSLPVSRIYKILLAAESYNKIKLQITVETYLRTTVRERLCVFTPGRQTWKRRIENSRLRAEFNVSDSHRRYGQNVSGVVDVVDWWSYRYVNAIINRIKKKKTNIYSFSYTITIVQMVFFPLFTPLYRMRKKNKTVWIRSFDQSRPFRNDSKKRKEINIIDTRYSWSCVNAYDVMLSDFVALLHRRRRAQLRNVIARRVHSVSVRNSAARSNLVV